MRKLLILACLLACQRLIAQAPLPEFASFSLEEINLKECPFEKNADAIVLLDEAVSEHDEDYRLITHRRIRIKILNSRELDRGNISIRFYSGDKFEYIENIKGVTCNPNGTEFTLTFLETKAIYTEKEDANYSNVKFAMPNVKAGSIIEYEYTSYKKHYGGLRSWVFQNEIPTLKSRYLLTLLPGSEFEYSVQKKGNYPIIVKPMPDQGKIYFEMNNIPGLKYEPYMDAVRDYLQRVDFQLASYMSSFGTKTKVNQSWEGLARDLMSDRDFGGTIKKDLSNTGEIKTIVAGETTASGKLAAIYNYVRNNFTWDGYIGVYAVDGLKTAWEKRSGSAAKINLILINLLQSFDVEVSPMLVAERDFGKIDTTYPFLERFNKVVAYAKADGKSFILDATQKYCPPGLTPYPLLNTVAFVVDKKDSRLVRILNRSSSYNNKITVTAVMDDKGEVKGDAEIASTGYAKETRTEKIKADPKKFIKQILQEDGSELVVDDFNFENLADDEKPLLQKIKFHNELNSSGGFVFFNYNLFTGFSKNPFTAPERFTNINFGYPYQITAEVKLQLPEKAKVDKLPPDKTVTSFDSSALVSRALRMENNTLIITLRFTQVTTLVGYDHYTTLRSLYTQFTDLLNEPVVIKIGN